MKEILFQEGIKRESRIPIKITRDENCCDDGLIADSDFDYLVNNTKYGMPGITILIACVGCRAVNSTSLSDSLTITLPAIIPNDVEDFDLIFRYDGKTAIPRNLEKKVRFKLSSNCEGVETTDKYLEPITLKLINRKPSPLSVEFTKNDITACGVNDGTIESIVDGGSGDYTYLWTGPGSFTRKTLNIDNLIAGEYTFTITDRITKESLKKKVIIYEPVLIDFTVKHVSYYNGNNGEIHINAKCGSCDYDYEWIFPDGSKKNLLKDLFGIKSGDYKLKVIDKVSGYSSSIIIVVKEPEMILNIVGNNISYYGGNDGSISLTIYDSTGKLGSGQYSYQWTGTNSFLSNEKDLFDLYAGRYTVEVSEFITGQKAIASIELNEPTANLIISSIIKNVSKFGLNDGEITIDIQGGSKQFSFTWEGPSINTSNMNQMNIKNLSPGRYTLTTYDTITCRTEINSFTIFQPEADIEIKLKGTNPTYWGAKNGNILLTIITGEPPFTYSWEGNDINGLPGSESTNKDINNVGKGIYKITVLDFIGNSISQTIELIQPELSISWDVIHAVNCGNNVNTGSVSLTVKGGIGPYKYEWSGPGITSKNINNANLENVIPGVYTVKITDTATGEIQTRTIVIREPSPDLSIRFEVKNISSPGGADGAITAIVDGAKGTENFKFEWTYVEDPTWRAYEEAIIGYDIPLNAPPDYKPLQVRAGTYILKIIAQNIMVSDDPSIGPLDDGPILISSITLTEPDPICCIDGLSISLVKTPITGFGRNDCTLRVIFNTWGTPPYSFKWMKDGLPFIDVNDERDGYLDHLAAGIYTVTVTDAVGRTATASDSCDCFIDPCKNQRFAELGENIPGNKMPDLVIWNLNGGQPFSIPTSFDTNVYSPEYISSVSHNQVINYSYEIDEIKFKNDNKLELKIPIIRGACCCGDVSIKYKHGIQGLSINGNINFEGNILVNVDESDENISNIILELIPPRLESSTEKNKNCSCLNMEITVICDHYSEFPTWTKIKDVSLSICLTNENILNLFPSLLSTEIENLTD